TFSFLIDAMVLSLFARDRNRAVRILHIALGRPVHEFAACAGKTDHLPAHHAFVAAILWIGEKTFFGVGPQETEESLGGDFFELDLAGFQVSEDLYLSGLIQAGVGFAELFLAILITG